MTLTGPEVAGALILLLGALTGLLVTIKRFYEKKIDRAEGNFPRKREDDLSSPPTKRESVIVMLTDRVHKLADDTNKAVWNEATQRQILEVKVAGLEKDLREAIASNARELAEVHKHIDEASGRLERSIAKDIALLESRLRNGVNGTKLNGA